MPRPVTYYLLPMLYLAMAILTLNGCTAASSASPDPQTIIIESIYWSDGDSGRLNGSLKFRLNDIDAPETGGVGVAVGGAKCEAERAKGYESKAWVVKFTKNVPLKYPKPMAMTDMKGSLSTCLRTEKMSDKVASRLATVKPGRMTARKP